MGFFDRIPGIGNDSDEDDETDQSRAGVPDDTGDGADDDSSRRDNKNDRLNDHIQNSEEYADVEASEVPPDETLFGDTPDSFEQHFDEVLEKNSDDESTEDSGSGEDDESTEDSGSGEDDGNSADVQPASNGQVTNGDGDGPGSKEAGATDKLSTEDIKELDTEEIDVTESEAGDSSDQSMDI